MVQNDWYLNGPPSHMTLPLEYRTPLLPGIQMFGILMVTVSGETQLRHDNSRIEGWQENPYK